MSSPTTVRRQLRDAGYCPIPLYGKEPPVYGKNTKRHGLAGWQTLHRVTPQQIELWGKTWPDALNTGILTRTTPALDLDILNEEAARAAEDLARERFEGRGYILVRIGKPPKRAIIFRGEPFPKITVDFVRGGKIEFLCDGQQIVVDGIHPDTKEPYRWFGGTPGEIKHDDLPYIHEAEARALVDDIAALLVRDYGYALTATTVHRPGQATSPEAWQRLAPGNDKIITEYRDAAACSVAGHLLRRWVEPRLVAGLMHAWNQTYVSPPLTDQELRDILNRVARREDQRRDALQGGDHARG